MLPTKRLQKKLRRKLLPKKRQLLPSPPKKPLPRRHPRIAEASDFGDWEEQGCKG